MKMKWMVGYLLAVNAAFGVTFEQAATSAGYTTSSGGIIDLENAGIDDLSGMTLYTSTPKAASQQ